MSLALSLTRLQVDCFSRWLYLSSGRKGCCCMARVPAQKYMDDLMDHLMFVVPTSCIVN